MDLNLLRRSSKTGANFMKLNITSLNSVGKIYQIRSLKDLTLLSEQIFEYLPV